MYICTLRTKNSVLDLPGSVSFLPAAKYLKEVQILTPLCALKLCQNFHAKALLSNIDVLLEMFSAN